MLLLLPYQVSTGKNTVGRATKRKNNGLLIYKPLKKSQNSKGQSPGGLCVL